MFIYRMTTQPTDTNTQIHTQTVNEVRERESERGRDYFNRRGKATTTTKIAQTQQSEKLVTLKKTSMRIPFSP